jgi:hypothetical protein
MLSQTFFLVGGVPEHANSGNSCRLLCDRKNWPGACRSAEQADEVPPLHATPSL